MRASRLFLGICSFAMASASNALPGYQCYHFDLPQNVNRNLNDSETQWSLSADTTTFQCKLETRGITCKLTDLTNDVSISQTSDLESGVYLDLGLVAQPRQGKSRFAGCYTYSSSPRKQISCAVTQNGRLVGRFNKTSMPTEGVTQLLLPTGNYFTCFMDRCGIVQRDQSVIEGPEFRVFDHNTIHAEIKIGNDSTVVDCENHRTLPPINLNGEELQVEPQIIDTQQQQFGFGLFRFARVDGDIFGIQSDSRWSYNIKTNKLTNGSYVNNLDFVLGEIDGFSYQLRKLYNSQSEITDAQISKVSLTEPKATYLPVIPRTVAGDIDYGVVNKDFAFLKGKAKAILVSLPQGTYSEVPLPPMLTGRHAATVVSANGGFVIWGGFNGAGQPLNTGAIYYPATNKWETINTDNAPTPRGYAYGFWNDKNLIVVAGRATEPNAQSTLTGSFYDFNQRSWSTMPLDGAPLLDNYIAPKLEGDTFTCSSRYQVAFDGRVITFDTMDMKKTGHILYVFDTQTRQWRHTKLFAKNNGGGGQINCPIYDWGVRVVADPGYASFYMMYDKSFKLVRYPLPK